MAATSNTAGADPLPKKSANSRPAADTIDIGPKLRKQSTVSLSKAERDKFADSAPATGSRMKKQSTAADAGTGGIPVGGEKTWMILDDEKGGYSAATFVLTALGNNIEVWVQKNLNYPTGDCRNDGVRNVVTSAQARYLADEFDNNILPIQSQFFSTAPARDGSQQEDIGFGAPLWDLLGGGDPNYYVGDGNKTIALISNVRDANYYDPTSPDGATYIAGFFSPTFNEAFDRNVMTIDSYDWLHRTGANPPDETPGGLCSAKQAARPHSYEGTFAHEYQHLLEYYQDGAESTWLNEGLSDYAQTLVGYVDTTLPYGVKGADSHLTCYQGFLGSDSFPYCGAENSLTRWEDQGSPSVLSDYGAAYAFVTYLENQFGRQAIQYLHTSDKQGLSSLQAYLDDHAPGLTTTDVLHDFLAQMALDRLVDDGAKGLTKDQKARFTADQLSSAIDWSWTGSYDSPGAPTNGGDFVLGIADRPVNGRTVGKINFSGATTYQPDPLAWTVDDNALYSGVGNELDNTAVYDVKVPAGARTLTISTKYNIEQDWDFGVVQVSTDGGKTYRTLPGTDTTSDHDPAAEGRIVDQLPGLTGLSDGYVPQSYDLSGYAGKDVKLSFRYLTDAASNGNNDDPSGWWIRDVKIGNTVITDGSNTDGARSATEISPIPVAGWSLQVVGWSLDGKTVAYADLKVGKDGTAKLNKGHAQKVFKKVDRIGFIVTADDPTETATKYAAYTLKINGVTQAGGGGQTATSSDPSVLAKQLPSSHRRQVF
ncbi:immune inhibitor A domain-containing protein [Microlunatus elymi]|nr:immune inhibitor A domain-containing protein [Microlunatus elymi]